MSNRLPRIDCPELTRAPKWAGFQEHRQRGSHLHLKCETDGKRVTVPVHKGRIIPPGTLRAILRDADISIEECASGWRHTPGRIEH